MIINQMDTHNRSEMVAVQRSLWRLHGGIGTTLLL
jgi:hypothetical protein